MALYRVVEGFGPLGLRKSPDPADEAFEEWHEWPDGEVFEPPAHMDVARALARGIIAGPVNAKGEMIDG